MSERRVLTPAGLEALLNALKSRGYRVVGPTVRDQAIVYDEIDSLADLPRGWTDDQDGGRYRLARREDAALWQAERDGGTVTVTAEPVADERLAFIGVRSCELHAMAIQDRVLLGGPHVDPHYRARREACLIVAVNCATAGGTCFCASMATGPKATAGFDVALTEITGEGEHRFVGEAGSAAGADLLADLPGDEAGADDIAAAEAIIARTAASMGREMEADGLRELLMRNLGHQRWDEVAERCLTCGNCTLVCPTCFCTSVEDSSDLEGARSSRSRRWDSCFTMDFTYIHGGSVRPTTRSRYRQWMTHKLATWHDQFGSSGCVGCGRCITWCPVGIDITEEVRAIRDSERGQGA